MNLINFEETRNCIIENHINPTVLNFKTEKDQSKQTLIQEWL